MKCSEVYRKWTQYLKSRGIYSEYLYTMGIVIRNDFFEITRLINNGEKPPLKLILLTQTDIIRSTFPFPANLECIIRPHIFKLMKFIDNRVQCLNKLCAYSEVPKVFTNGIIWADVAREFFIDELKKKYGEEALKRMRKRREIRRKQLRRAEEERERRRLESTWNIEPNGGLYFEFPDPPVTATARTYAPTTRHRDREERGQWYDRLNRNNIRRQDRWRFRR